MKSAPRKGTYADLNVYWIPDSQYLSYAYTPDAVARFSAKVLHREWVLIMLVDHTFGKGDSSCSGDGDVVSDTPFEATSADGCQVGRDTCANDLGLDPVTYYIDYSDDAWLSEFTPGQTARIISYWNAYRAGFVQTAY
ncbi:hypothetical protein K504DRAFT_497374 [Pleomassaria siparia CBS 279.74]|uniref:Uncharacterized protein n=1 Tax=Pleomassaria siparia CBS 279.74 TaxID=1314801 RepID=A0A6G1KRR5_9PLEO|nr:hypothetical protein K504DRAFT_497374 [Pleomassaria siparia CBS 279.74]